MKLGLLELLMNWILGQEKGSQQRKTEVKGGSRLPPTSTHTHTHTHMHKHQSPRCVSVHSWWELGRALNCYFYDVQKKQLHWIIWYLINGWCCQIIFTKFNHECLHWSPSMFPPPPTDESNCINMQVSCERAVYKGSSISPFALRKINK